MLFIPSDRYRQLTHLCMLLLSFIAWIVTYWVNPNASFARVVTIGLGYLALAQIILTLLVGPAQLLLKAALRRNPVNITLRRDVGIWAGINGLLHVAFGLQVHRGGDFVQYFFERVHDGWRLLPISDVFGFSNYTGGLATILLSVLFLLSNDLALKWLRGPMWKWIQRLNYVMIVLVLAHTFGYQVETQRPAVLIVIVVVLTLIALTTQLTGFIVSMSRRVPQTAATAGVDRGCLVAIGMTAVVPLLLGACLAGLWLYGVNRVETRDPLPVHITEPPAHSTRPPQHQATPMHNAP
ncbi:MAG: ferric reductase-like transmembrane domain-containing protein [Chloroflexi bacterium]|nr:ferric reductase-like transmembrane domain-containing protein [Chloroflexota bacterium]